MMASFGVDSEMTTVGNLSRSSDLVGRAMPPRTNFRKMRRCECSPTLTCESVSQLAAVAELGSRGVIVKG